MRSPLSVAVLTLLVAAASSACGSDPIVTTPTEPTVVTETFSGTVTVNGAMTHNFFTTTTGTVTATLSELSPETTEKIGLSMGTFAVPNCSVVLTNDSAVKTSILTGTVTTLGGSLCVRIYDVGALTEPVAYTITVVHP